MERRTVSVAFLWQQNGGMSTKVYPAIDHDYQRDVYFEDNGKPKQNGSAIVRQVHILDSSEIGLPIAKLSLLHPYKEPAL